MMLKEALDWIKGHAVPESVVTDDGREYLAYGGDLNPLSPPKAATITINTLTGLVGYVLSEFDAKMANLLIHIASPEQVHLLGGLDNWRQRERLATAVAEKSRFSFGSFMDTEDFTIAMMSHFVADENTAAILALIGNIKDGRVGTFADDGVTQEVTVKTGITRVSTVPVPNPVLLRPYRTFSEVDQPQSPFVFRLRSGNGDRPPTCALFESGDVQWKVEAARSILYHLSRAITGDIRIIL